MIDIVIVYETLTDVITSVYMTAKDLKEVEELSKWYFENRHIKNYYITFIGDRKK